jgi:hypothetical protein
MAVENTVAVLQHCYNQQEQDARLNVWQYLSSGVNVLLGENKLAAIRAFSTVAGFKHGLAAYSKLLVLIFAPVVLQPVCPVGLQRFLAPLYLHSRYASMLMQHRCAG